MQTITNEQIYDRWEQVPEVLREAFFSTENGEIVWKACEDAGLSEDVIDNVLIVLGNILLGFTHINDLAKELLSIPGMDPKAVDPIIFQIDKRIIDPLKVDILRLYGLVSGAASRMAAPAVETPVKITAEEPKILTETTQLEIGKAKVEGAGELATKAAESSIEAPAIIHAEMEVKPVAQKKHAPSSFGGLFGFRKGGEHKGGPTITAQVGMIEGVGKRLEDVPRMDQQPIRVVHYTSAKASEDMFGQAVKSEQQVPSIPVMRQEHGFEPAMINLAEHPATKDMFSQGKAMPALGARAEAESERPTGVPRMINETASIPAAPVTIQTQTIEVPALREMPVPQVVNPEMGQTVSAEGAMPVAPPVTVMKTPQRPEPVEIPKQQKVEPRLAEIPIADDIVDLRMLGREGNDQRTTQK